MTPPRPVVSLVLLHELPDVLAGQFPAVCEQPVLFCNHPLARRLSSDQTLLLSGNFGEERKRGVV